MSNGINKPTPRQQVKSISERVNAVEQNVARVLVAINQRFQEDGNRLNTLDEFIDALMENAGRAEILAIVNDKRVGRARTAAENEKRLLEEGIADGYITKTDKAGEKTLVVGKYVSADGNDIEPGRVQLVMPTIQGEFKTKLLGQAAGFSLDLPGGGKFVTLELYEVDEAKFNEVRNAKATKAAQDALEAAKASTEADAAAEAPAADTADESKQS
jgi:hypothetical protein